MHLMGKRQHGPPSTFFNYIFSVPDELLRFLYPIILILIRSLIQQSQSQSQSQSQNQIVIIPPDPALTAAPPAITKPPYPPYHHHHPPYSILDDHDHYALFGAQFLPFRTNKETFQKFKIQQEKKTTQLLQIDMEQM